VPHTIAMEFDGAFAPGVSAKDAMLFLIGRFGLDGGQYQAVEYRGAAIRALPMQERMTLCNMAAELGAQTGLIASDGVTQAFLQSKNLETWDSDDGASLLAHHRFHGDELAPQVEFREAAGEGAAGVPGTGIRWRKYRQPWLRSWSRARRGATR